VLQSRSMNNVLANLKYPCPKTYFVTTRRTRMSANTDQQLTPTDAKKIWIKRIAMIYAESKVIATVTLMSVVMFLGSGGGKTEAYLSLTAYTLGLRRLQGTVEGRSGENGVAVLMRYTLRLLTLQQFQRATALICACEDIRRTAMSTGDTRWGKVPYRIGLWVGGSTTPNWNSDSDEAVKSGVSSIWSAISSRFCS
jgi:hypothetical protein